MEVIVSVDKFNEMGESLNIPLFDLNKASAVIRVGKKQYIPVAAMCLPSRVHRWSTIDCYECVHHSIYEGEKHTYQELRQLINQGDHPGDYINFEVDVNGERFVMIGSRITFVPILEKQASLF